MKVGAALLVATLALSLPLFPTSAQESEAYLFETSREEVIASQDLTDGIQPLDATGEAPLSSEPSLDGCPLSLDEVTKSVIGATLEDYTSACACTADVKKTFEVKYCTKFQPITFMGKDPKDAQKDFVVDCLGATPNTTTIVNANSLAVLNADVIKQLQLEQKCKDVCARANAVSTPLISFTYGTRCNKDVAAGTLSCKQAVVPLAPPDPKGKKCRVQMTCPSDLIANNVGYVGYACQCEGMFPGEC